MESLQVQGLSAGMKAFERDLDSIKSECRVPSVQLHYTKVRNGLEVVQLWRAGRSLPFTRPELSRRV